MAEAILRDKYGDTFIVNSAGTEATEVNPFAIKVLQEKGIDTSGLRSKSVEEFLDEEIDLVVTVCDHAKEACPFFPGAKEYLHKGFKDPPELIEEGMEPMKAFGKIRDEISDWIEATFESI
jgi:arsenate reductase